MHNDMVSDLIRAAMLSASHAPVNQLIAAYLPEPVIVKPGSRVRVVADLARVRIGMAISMVSDGTTRVRGRVADISGGEVTAEVHTTVPLCDRGASHPSKRYALEKLRGKY